MLRSYVIIHDQHRWPTLSQRIPCNSYSMQYFTESRLLFHHMTCRVTTTSNGTQTSSSEATLRLYSKWRTRQQQTTASDEHLISCIPCFHQRGCGLQWFEAPDSRGPTVRREVGAEWKWVRKNVLTEKYFARKEKKKGERWGKKWKST